jgi:SAM-dependent methyltransferase
VSNPTRPEGAQSVDNLSEQDDVGTSADAGGSGSKKLKPGMSGRPAPTSPPRPVPSEPPITAMPVIMLGDSPKVPGDEVSFSVGPTGVRRGSVPPPAIAPQPAERGYGENEEATRPDRKVLALDEAPAGAEQEIEEIEPEPDSAPPPPVQVAAAQAEPEEVEPEPEEVEPEPDSGPAAAAAAKTAEPAETNARPIADRISEIPPEVAPEDIEISEVAPAAAAPAAAAPAVAAPAAVAPAVAAAAVQAVSPAPSAAAQPISGISLGVSPPAPTLAVSRARDMAAAVAAQVSVPQWPAAEASSFKRTRHWWDEVFGDDFLRTMDRLTPSQVKAEASFIEESMAVERGGIVLDLGCGAGQHAVELASRGYSVVGLDLSLAMLARAADEAQERNQKLNFLQGDMREMSFEEMFDGIFCWATTFGYFDEEKNAQVAQRVFRALRKGGMFLLDVVNRDFAAQQQPSLVWFEGDGCVCMDEMRVDFITSRLRVKRMVMLDDGRTREVEYSIRLYSLHELGRLLHDVGFKVTEVSGRTATPGVFLGAESPRLIVLAEKA